MNFLDQVSKVLNESDRPDVIVDYNNGMNKVDITDAGFTRYSLFDAITNCRWERRLSLDLIDMLINNSFQLFRLVSINSDSLVISAL